MSLGDLFGPIGQVASADIQHTAQQDATNAQLQAIREQRNYLFKNLNPQDIAGQAGTQDTAAALARLKLQGQIDPALLSQRYAAETAIGNQLGQIGANSTPVMNQATAEALAGTPGLEDTKDQLVKQAQADLAAGATLPPDVEAQLVQAGLEKSGMVTGAASAKGIGGQQIRTLLGTQGIQLQQQREQAAANLSAAAGNLETQRQNILQSLFPKLAATQLTNLGATQSVLGQSDSLATPVGLTGTDVANLWLARVGANNQLTAQAGNVAAQGALAQGGIASGLVGAAAGGASIGYNNIKNWLNPPTSPQTSAAVDRSLAGGVQDIPVDETAGE